MGDTPTGEGEQCEKEGVAKIMYYVQTTAPILHPSTSPGRRKQKSRVKLSLGRRDGGEKVILVLFLSVTVLLSN